MTFEFDPQKSASNELKHGVNFEQAEVMWHDQKAITLQTMTEPEVRFVRIVGFTNVIWRIVYTIRNENIRFISVRGQNGRRKNYMAKAKKMSTEEFDRRIDAGEDSTEIVEYKIIPNHEVPATQRVNVDLPLALLTKLDLAAGVRGISRQSLIKTWLYEKIKGE